jgi:DmsE family decaheme c-type cytochrome
VTGTSVHGPVAAKQCLACHKPSEAPEGPKRKAYVLTARGGKFCASCHEEVADRNKRKSVHGPSAIGDCAACHLPHNSPRKFLLKEGKAKVICYNCHDDLAKKAKAVHGPVAMGECGACHDPHASDNKFHLRKPERDLCFSCHEEQLPDFSRPYPHKPATDSCVTCHDPQGSFDSTLTKKAGAALCAPCHNVVTEADNQGISPHRTAFGPKACTRCHLPHGSELKKHLRSDPATICTSPCHTHAPILERKALPTVHKPFSKGVCFDCHAPHATSAPALLKSSFPERTMQAYNPNAYGLCWSCHKAALVESEDGTKTTGFRNGKANLHAVHVIDQQYNCRVCHEEHAGEQPRLVRTNVLFSTMSFGATSPFTYTKTANGGDCVAECHGDLSYDRVKAVKY